MQQKSLGQKIYDLRTRHGYSQGELGNLLGVSRQSVSKWELDTAAPNADNIKELCKLFSVSADFLLCENESANEQKKEFTQGQNDLVKQTKAKPKQKSLILIILLFLFGFLLAFVATVMGFSLFTSNRGLETIYIFSWGDSLIYIFIAIVAIAVILIGLGSYLIIKKRK